MKMKSCSASIKILSARPPTIPAYLSTGLTRGYSRAGSASGVSSRASIAHKEGKGCGTLCVPVSAQRIEPGPTTKQKSPINSPINPAEGLAACKAAIATQRPPQEHRR